MIKRGLYILVLVCWRAPIASAFSPYENHLQTADVKRVALIASVKPGQEAATDATLKSLHDKQTSKALKKNNITNLSCYTKKLSGKTWVMIYFDYSGDDYLSAARSFEAAGSAITDLSKLTDPHPRATSYGTTWLQMEWICYIRGSASDEKSQNTYAMVTTIKPEKEREYRLLHEAVWPGVVDQMARGNNRNFSIFLVEIDDSIYEFFYVEYVGSDQEKDSEMDRTDPANIRWWKLTDPCQTPLPGAKGIWSMMGKVSYTESVKEGK